jgi:hypothetical protein
VRRRATRAGSPDPSDEDGSTSPIATWRYCSANECLLRGAFKRSEQDRRPFRPSRRSPVTSLPAGRYSHASVEFFGVLRAHRIDNAGSSLIRLHLRPPAMRLLGLLSIRSRSSECHETPRRHTTRYGQRHLTWFRDHRQMERHLSRHAQPEAPRCRLTETVYVATTTVEPEWEDELTAGMTRSTCPICPGARLFSARRYVAVEGEPVPAFYGSLDR